MLPAVATNQDVLDFVLSSYESRMSRWSGLRTRQAEMDALVNDRWATVFPDDVSDNELPMVANNFKVHIEDMGRLFSEQIPTSQVYPTDLTPEERQRAEKRTRILNSYHSLSGLMEKPVREKFGQDMGAAGLSGIRVWPDLARPPWLRQPKFKRLNPRFILPEPGWEPEEWTDDVMCVYRESVVRLRQQFPEPVNQLFAMIAQRMAGVSAYPRVGGGLLLSSNMPTGGPATNAPPAELDVIDYYSSSWLCRVARYATPQTPSGMFAEPAASGVDAVVLMAMPWDLSYCPVQISARSAWSLDPSGQMDSSKGITLGRNRFFRLFLDYMTEVIYGGKLVWNVQDPFLSGPGSRYIAMGPDAFMTPIVPAVSPQLAQVLTMLDDEGRTSSIDPRSREGEVDLNKASAAFLSKAQGQLSSLTSSLQGSFATALKRCNEIAMEMDERWCPGTKKITGRARGKRFADTYDPNLDIAGDYANEVTYGGVAGIDPVTANVMQLQQVGEGNLSRITAMENSPFVDDVDAEQSRLRVQALEESVFQGFLDASVPLSVRLKALREAYQEKDASALAELLQPVIDAAEAAAQQAANPAAPGYPPEGVQAGRPIGPYQPPGVPAQAPALPPLDMVKAMGRR